MRLRTKFIILIGVVVVVSYGITFYRTSAFQHELVLQYATQQARMMYRQVLLTRKWVANHNGLFVLKQPGVDINPFLKEGEIVDTAGRHYVKRNPAMVTRELSELAFDEGAWRYRVTSLKPINPANEPDDFERRSLERFEHGTVENIEIHKSKEGKHLRYIAPLLVEESCLLCHADQGYQIGDVRGGLSVSIPLDWVYKNIDVNNRMLLIIALMTIVLVSVTIFLFIDFLVVRRLGTLAKAMDHFPEQSDQEMNLPKGNDEVSSLSDKFRELCHRLVTYQDELHKTREQVFQNEKLAALGRLTAGIAHEINNPLGGMLNCLKSMQEAPDDRDMNSRYMELLAKGLNRIGHTVRQLLNFGRREPLQRRLVDIDDLIRECLSLLEYGMKDIKLTLHLNLRRQHSMDVEALKQVVMNICLNAMQAMPDGGTFSVQSIETFTTVVLLFEDTGVGIDEEDLDKIFDPFFSTKEVGEGTGLGLSVTYSLVKRMGGAITAESRKDEGTLFRIELPLSRPKSATVSEQQLVNQHG